MARANTTTPAKLERFKSTWAQIEPGVDHHSNEAEEAAHQAAMAAAWALFDSLEEERRETK